MHGTAPAVEGGAHLVDRREVAADRSERGSLGDVGDVGGGVRLQVGGGADDVAGPISHPTRHPVIA